MDRLIADVMALLDHPHAVSELFIILALIGCAAFFARRFRQSAAVGDSVQATGLRRLAFPVMAAILLGIAGAVIERLGWPHRVFEIATHLFFALALIRMVVFALRYVSKAPWIASFERYIAFSIWTILVLDVIGILPDFVVWLESVSLPIGGEKLTLWALIQGGAMALATMLGAFWLGGQLEERLMATRIDSSLKVVLSRLAKALLLAVAILTGMSIAGVDLTALSVFGGALGVGLGFGMQKIASNYVSGFIILLDRSIKLGNIIQVGADRGVVEKITTRYTVLRAATGSNVILPNEVLVSSVVQNDTFSDRELRLSTTVQVSYATDVEATLSLLQEIAAEHPRVLKDPAPTSFLVSFDDSGITLEVAMWIADPENGMKSVCSDVNRAILRRFRALGIEIPFPQREIRMLGNPS